MTAFIYDRDDIAITFVKRSLRYRSLKHHIFQFWRRLQVLIALWLRLQHRSADQWLALVLSEAAQPHLEPPSMTMSCYRQETLLLQQQLAPLPLCVSSSPLRGEPLAMQKNSWWTQAHCSINFTAIRVTASLFTISLLLLHAPSSECNSPICDCQSFSICQRVMSQPFDLLMFGSHDPAFLSYHNSNETGH